jgi:thiol-disulfide isomerase/thioredoxin
VTIGLLVAAIVILASTVFGLVRRARDGRVRAAVPASSPLLAGLGVEAGPVTLLQFSSEYCAPCRATSALCAELAATVEGVRHVEVDAAEHLDAVRELGIRRTPTLLVVDGAGRIVSRAVGRPDRAELLAALPVRSTP